MLSAQQKKIVIVLVGPTAIGKTDLAIELAEHLNTEIISADSRQIFRELPIGTAAPDAVQRARIKHYFVGTHGIEEYYSASMFEEEVQTLLDEKFAHTNFMVMTGGSGMYLNAALHGIDDYPTVDPQLRLELAEVYKKEGIESLRNQLKRIDPVYYNQVDLKNPNRILKGLEITLMTGKPYSSMLTRVKKERPYEIVKVGLTAKREFIYERIHLRVNKMVEQGFVNEAQTVYPYKHLNSLNTVGYKELFAHFEGEINLEEALEKVKQHTRHFAKRQLTWFARDKEIVWFDISEKKHLVNYVLDKCNIMN